MFIHYVHERTGDVLYLQKENKRKQNKQKKQQRAEITELYTHVLLYACVMGREEPSVCSQGADYPAERHV